MKRSGSESNSPSSKRTRFLIENILQSSPPRKRTRFLIEDILSSSPQRKRARFDDMPIQIGSGLSKYVDQLDNSVKYLAKFKTLACKSKFAIKDLPGDPERLLSDIFQAAIANAMKESQKRGVNPTHLGCIISSVQLDPDIYIPIRPITTNTVDSILNRFLQIGQSKKQDENSLYGQPFSIDITTLDRKGLQSQKITGSRRTYGKVQHRVSDHNLIKV